MANKTGFWLTVKSATHQYVHVLFFFSSTSVSWFCSTVATGRQTTATPPCPQRPRPFSWTAGSTATRWPAPTRSPLTRSNSAAAPTPYPPRTCQPPKGSCPEPEGKGSLASSEDHGLNLCPFLLYINVLNVWRCTCEGGNVPCVRFVFLTFHMACPAQVSVLHPNKVVKRLKWGSFPTPLIFKGPLCAQIQSDVIQEEANMWKEVFHIKDALCPARNWEAQTKKSIKQISTT